MSFTVAAVAGIVGEVVTGVPRTVKMIDGAVQKHKAKKEAEDAEKDLEKRKNQFASLDTTNPYLNMENTMEDLTVNKQAAEFQAQQSMQSQANIMQQMRGAAGGSGIAAQKAAADIGKQEAANQLAERQMAGQLQSKEREGEIISRQAEFGKVKSLMGMEADRLANAREREQQARDQIYEGADQVGQGAEEFGDAYMGGQEMGAWKKRYPGGVGGSKKKNKK